MTLKLALMLVLAAAGVAQAQGLEPETPDDLATFPKAAVTRGIAVIPSLVILEGVQAPGDQGRTSTCVSWAAAYAAGSYFHRTRLAGAPLSPAFAYAIGNGDARCLAPSRTSRVLDAMRDVGAFPAAQYTFDPGWCGRLPSASERHTAASYRIPGWAALSTNHPDAARSQLAAGRMVIFSLPIGAAFNNHTGSGVFDTLEDLPDGYWHAMVAIGYDDGKQAFRIQNSAGRSWGDGGQAWLSYRVWKERSGAGYVIVEKAAANPH